MLFWILRKCDPMYPYVAIIHTAIISPKLYAAICTNCTEPHVCIAPFVCACPTDWSGDGFTGKLRKLSGLRSQILGNPYIARSSPKCEPNSNRIR